MTGLRVLTAKAGRPDELHYWDLSEPVWGIEDVARGHWPESPTTFYLMRNRDRSGVMGVAFPDGEVIRKAGSTTGQVFDVVDEDLNHYEGEVVWDGAQPSPISSTPIGFHDVEELQPIYQESSKGILLGDYPNNGELWNAIAVGREMV